MTWKVEKVNINKRVEGGKSYKKFQVSLNTSSSGTLIIFIRFTP